MINIQIFAIAIICRTLSICSFITFHSKKPFWSSYICENKNAFNLSFTISSRTVLDDITLIVLCITLYFNTYVSVIVVLVSSTFLFYAFVKVFYLLPFLVLFLWIVAIFSLFYEVCLESRQMASYSLYILLFWSSEVFGILVLFRNLLNSSVFETKANKSWWYDSHKALV